MQNYWEKIVLGVAALVLVLCLVLAFFSIRESPEALPGPAGDGQLPPSVVPVADGAVSMFESEQTWTSPAVGASDSKLSLFISRPVLISKENPNEPIEMDKEDALLHPPVPNLFFVEHNLPYLRSDVLDMDPDSDGFSNLEEYEGGTNPRDASERPPVTAKLALEDLATSSRYFRYNFRGGERHGVQLGTMAGNQFRGGSTNYFQAAGDTFGPEDRYQVVEIGADGVTVRDNTIPEGARNATFSLPFQEVASVDEFTAVFLFTLRNPSGERIEVPEREEFTLPGGDDQRFLLESIDEEAMTAQVAELDKNNESDEPVNRLTIGPDGPQ